MGVRTLKDVKVLTPGQLTKRLKERWDYGEEGVIYPLARAMKERGQEAAPRRAVLIATQLLRAIVGAK